MNDAVHILNGLMNVGSRNEHQSLKYSRLSAYYIRGMQGVVAQEDKWRLINLGEYPVNNEKSQEIYRKQHLIEKKSLYKNRDSGHIQILKNIYASLIFFS